LTPTQLRLAKSALRMVNRDIQEITGLHKNTLLRAEAGQASPATMRLLRAFFMERGVKFIETDDEELIGILIPMKTQKELDGVED